MQLGSFPNKATKLLPVFLWILKQGLWQEIGESEEDKDRMLMEIERECMLVYRRKVEQASKTRAQLHQALTAKEAELAALVASLGEHDLHFQSDRRSRSSKEQLAFITPLVEDLTEKKGLRIKQFAEIKSQIKNIKLEIMGFDYYDAKQRSSKLEEHDLSIHKLSEYQTELRALQKDKSDRLQKVAEYVNEVRSLCTVLGLDFANTIDEVHPSLYETSTGQSTSIRDSTLRDLDQTVLKLRTEKKIRTAQLREAVQSLLKLWALMESSEEDRLHFLRVTCILESPEDDVTAPDILSAETIEQTEAEVKRLTKLKASRMKELVVKRRSELEQICKETYLEPDMGTVAEKCIARIDSGLIDASELLSNIEAQILKAKEESASRKEIVDIVNKWLAACEEENWLENYNQDENRYHAGRNTHLNLKRAEKARLTVSRIPAVVENLMSKAFAWEDKRNTPLMFDGIRLVSVLEEYKHSRQTKEEERRHQRDQKKLQNLLLSDKEAIYASKPSAKKSDSLYLKSVIFHGNRNGSGFWTPPPQRNSAAARNGGAPPELVTPRLSSGQQNGYLKEMRRFSTSPLNLIALPKEDTSSSFASISRSNRGSPLHPQMQF